MIIDAALIHKCADPSLKPAIVEAFIKQAGSNDPLSVTLKSGSKIYLILKAKTPDEALRLVRHYIGQAVVRAGITQYPAGFGITAPSQLSADLFDPCKNITMGTALFAKVYRITTKWYRNPVSEAFDDAIYAWGTGYFDNKYVFAEPDPGVDMKLAVPDDGEIKAGHDGKTASSAQDQADSSDAAPAQPPEEDPNKAGIVIDLSGIKRYNSGK